MYRLDKYKAFLDYRGGLRCGVWSFLDCFGIVFFIVLSFARCDLKGNYFGLLLQGVGGCVTWFAWAGLFSSLSAFGRKYEVILLLAAMASCYFICNNSYLILFLLFYIQRAHQNSFIFTFYLKKQFRTYKQNSI